MDISNKTFHTSVAPRGVSHLPSLAKDGSQIRLLTVHPFLDEGLVSCTLRTYAVDSRPEYSALSYMWGKQSGRCRRQILLNGLPTQVGQNLADFLRSVRRPGDLRQTLQTALWIDALCIDQCNNEEKSQQVGMMGSIYHSAHEVCVWLGTDDREWRSLKFADPKPIHCPDWYAQQGCARMICKNPYFARLWVVQEVKLARKIAVACGKLVITQHHLAQYKRIIHRHSLSSGYVAKWFFDPSVVSGSGSQSIEFWLQQLRSQECTDMRDRVYAIRSLMGDGNDVVPDYSLKLRELYLVIILNRLRYFSTSVYIAIRELDRALKQTLKMRKGYNLKLITSARQSLPKIVGEPLYRTDVVIHSVVVRGSTASRDRSRKPVRGFSFAPTARSHFEIPAAFDNSIDWSRQTNCTADIPDNLGVGITGMRWENIRIAACPENSFATYSAKFFVNCHVAVGSVICSIGTSTKVFVVLQRALFVPEGVTYDESNPAFETLGTWLTWTLQGLAILGDGQPDVVDTMDMSRAKCELYMVLVGMRLRVYLNKQEASQISMLINRSSTKSSRSVYTDDSDD